MPSASILIVNYNTCDILRECLTALYAHGGQAHEVIVVDNASVDDSCRMVREEFAQVVLLEAKENLGFGAANNLAAQHATHPYLVLLNSDAILRRDTPRLLVDYLRREPRVSCVGPRIVLPVSGAPQPKAFGYLPTSRRVLMQSLGLNRLFKTSPFFRGIDGEHRQGREMPVGWLSGVCMAMRTADFLKVGGFDARFFMYCEDVELCIKLQALGQVVLLDDFDVMHYGGASSKSIVAKTRNSLWQQRHLLMIIAQYQGSAAALLSRIFMATGLLLRVLAGLLKIPVRGCRGNEDLQTAWARLKDIAGIDAMRLAGK